ncbi:UNVERIFIED_CONTAM: cytochrome [Sesamum latifolium]|uniref:Cytochrome n=1 Tax=Sesamum latifolium TaxID=2727402 RepID=A0AAW2U1B7_9LAMI
MQVSVEGIPFLKTHSTHTTSTRTKNGVLPPPLHPPCSPHTPLSNPQKTPTKAASRSGGASSDRNLPPGRRHTLHEYFRQLSKEYGPLLYFKLGSRPVLVANSSRTAEKILKTQDLAFCSRPPLLALRKLSYGGFDIAFAPYGEYWREMRKICVLHLLSAARVRSFRPIREDEVSRLVQKLSEQASRAETINMTERITFLTSTIICRVAFGKRYEHGTGESKEFNHIIREFQTAMSALYFTDHFPWLGWLDKVLGKIDELERVYKKWDLFYQQLLDEHQQPDRPKSMDGTSSI